MSLTQEYPRIHKAIFILDKTRRYAFDVNENITIHRLKKMIINAAGLGKVGLRIFHDGVEYTQNDPDTMDVLFPNLTEVIFTLSISYDNIEQCDELIKLKLSDNYCPLHFAKYPYFYCFTCGKSICSQCLLSHDHDGHNYKEKYDYLQSSRVLTEKLFKDLTDNIESTDNEYIMALKDKISIKFFPSLVKMVKEIENKLIMLVEQFVLKEKDNIQIVKNNMIALKKNCADGLDELKDKISIEDMMLDDEIFLTFDRKFKDIASEKNRIIKNIEEYNQFKQQLKLVGDAVEKIYLEIHSFLEKYLTSDIYSKLTKEIESVDIIPLSRKDIFYKLLSDVKKSTKKYSGKKKKHSENNEYDNNNNYDNDYYNETAYRPSKKVEIPSSTIPSNINVPLFQSSVKESSSQVYSSAKGKNKKAMSESGLSYLDVKFVCQPIENSCNILVYNVLNQKITKDTFISNKSILEKVPQNSAWINHNNYLYISGGEINGKISTSLVKYDPSNGKLDFVSQIPDKKEFHSMCADNESIYLIGGLTKTVLKFNVNTEKWTTFKNTLHAQRNNPICLVKDNDLYVFFGKDLYGGFVNSYEKTTAGGRGNFVMYNPPENINLIYSGLLLTKTNEIIFFGGRNENGSTNGSLKFDPSTNQFMKVPYQLKDKASFHQSVLPQIGENCFGNFSLDGLNNFTKINFS